MSEITLSETNYLRIRNHGYIRRLVLLIFVLPIAYFKGLFDTNFQREIILLLTLSVACYSFYDKYFRILSKITVENEKFEIFYWSIFNLEQISCLATDIKTEIEISNLEFSNGLDKQFGNIRLILPKKNLQFSLIGSDLIDLIIFLYRYSELNLTNQQKFELRVALPHLDELKRKKLKTIIV